MSILNWFRGKPKTDVSEEDTEDAFVDRGSERLNAYAQAVVTTPSGQQKQGVLIDISETGARLRFVSADGLFVGETVRISVALKRIKEFGLIRWRDKTDIGVHFVYKKTDTKSA